MFYKISKFFGIRKNKTHTKNYEELENLINLHIKNIDNNASIKKDINEIIDKFLKLEQQHKMIIINNLYTRCLKLKIKTIILEEYIKMNESN